MSETTDKYLANFGTLGVSVRSFAADVRNGLSDTQILAKNNLSREPWLNYINAAHTLIQIENDENQSLASSGQRLQSRLDIKPSESPLGSIIKSDQDKILAVLALGAIGLTIFTGVKG